jgi:endonuclease/exonuclease/phosphatase family metal-dependent hydrolase
MKVLTWNLFHGRAQPPAGRDLLPEFREALAGWDWDVACLQEVPPWWPLPLAQGCGASMRMVLTSRNELLPARRFVAERWPDLIKSGGGGSNAILIRDASVSEHVRIPLRVLPERRVAHVVRLTSGVCVTNIHAEKQPRPQPVRDIARAATALATWTGDEGALVFAGDFNIGDPTVPGLDHISWHGVDHVFARGLSRVGRGEVLDPRPLSDHRPIRVELA